MGDQHVRRLGLAQGLAVGLPFSTMISPVLVAKSFGVLDARLASVTVFMFDGAAEANTSPARPG